MGSLQDQLLKSGLASPEQLRKAQAEQRREKRREPRGKRGKRDDSQTPGLRPPKRSGGGRQAAGERQRTDGGGKEGKGRAPSGSQPGKEPSVHALNLRIRDLLDRHAQNDRSAELAFSFMRENTVRRVYVTDAQRRKLAGGELAVVGFRRRHHIVPSGVADEIQGLRPIVFVHRAGAAGAGASATDASTDDDPYRDFPVPDDLHW